MIEYISYSITITILGSFACMTDLFRYVLYGNFVSYAISWKNILRTNTILSNVAIMTQL